MSAESTPSSPAAGDPTAPTVRELADRWVETLTDLDPVVATTLGTRPGDDRLPDLSPDGLEALAAAERDVLASLPTARVTDDDDRRCAALLRDRLEARLALHDSGELLASLRPVACPVQTLQSIFLMMPATTPDDWAVVARRMARVADAVDSYRAALAEGLRTGSVSAPRQVLAVAAQLDDWLAASDGAGWFAGFASRAQVPALEADLTRAAASASEGIAGLRDWLRTTYLPAVTDVPDGVGRDRYLLNARQFLGARIDPEEAYAWGWGELARIEAEMVAEADRVRTGASPAEAFAFLDSSGPAIEGVDEVVAYLQGLMDETIADLDGRVVDVAEPVRRVEAMIAPPGAAAAPYYTRPTLDFSRPGRTWLPTLGRTRFPLFDLVSTWYHEGVPGHHLQLGTWAYRSGALSRYQTTIGSLSANTEGWALYAERLMDELGYFGDPGVRLGYLDNQRMRAVRVVIDIGMHLGLRIPHSAEAAGFHPGETWTAALGEEFFLAHSGSPADFVRSELERYLGWPGQAISYKLGERAWLAGREAARRRREANGDSFDLRAWHTAALGLGSLGLEDLERELTAL